MASFGSTMTLPDGQKLAIRNVKRVWVAEGRLHLDPKITTLFVGRETLRLTVEPVE
jgi:hypothetical protein